MLNIHGTQHVPVQELVSPPCLAAAAVALYPARGGARAPQLVRAR